jgi:hypothetical protein
VLACGVDGGGAALVGTLLDVANAGAELVIVAAAKSMQR